jgi:tagaturonate reductase
MRVSKTNIQQIDSSKVTLPAQEIFNLPEKVLQFGTGVLLRGLPDYFIDKANNENRFGGRVVVVKSTDHGDTSAFEQQDNLYTICTRGIENGQPVERNSLNASISRVLSAKTDWAAILQCAHNPQLQFIISNTTEVGIQLQVADVQNEVPVSFPGRLLAFLQERYHAFKGSAESGLIILPTELISNNGSELQSIVTELAQLKNADAAFIHWLQTHNRFCNTLVDRIVPGKPNNINAIQQTLGYEDALLIEAEPFTLWAIEGDAAIDQRIGFQDKAAGCLVVKDLNVYRELKLRLLNATHSFCCGLAFFNGFPTVASAMQDEGFRGSVKALLYNEIAPAIPYPIDATEINRFADAVMERFANPYLKHYWINISLQYSLKFKARCIPLLKNYIATNGQLPPNMVKGFAAYIAFMKVTEQKGSDYYGLFNQITYPIQDSEAAFFREVWQNANSTAGVVKAVLANSTFWNEDLLSINGLLEGITEQLNKLFTQHGLTMTSPELSQKETVYHEQ